MTDEEVRECGCPYVECPKCKNILAIGWTFDIQNRSLLDITCYCNNCNKTFYGRRNSTCLELFDRQDVPLFQKGDYHVPFMRYGKISLTGAKELFEES